MTIYSKAWDVAFWIACAALIVGMAYGLFIGLRSIDYYAWFFFPAFAVATLRSIVAGEVMAKGLREPVERRRRPFLFWCIAGTQGFLAVFFLIHIILHLMK